VAQQVKTQRCALLCERKIGEILLAMKARKELREGRKRKTTIDGDDSCFSETTSLQDLQITPDESSNAQALASVPEPVLEQIINEQTDQKKQSLSKQAVIREVKKVVKPDSVHDNRLAESGRYALRRLGSDRHLPWTVGVSRYVASERQPAGRHVVYRGNALAVAGYPGNWSSAVGRSLVHPVAPVTNTCHKRFFV
jgi:hypothetical protein